MNNPNEIERRIMTRRHFTKRTAQGTLGAALGLGVIGSISSRLHAEDTSTNDWFITAVKFVPTKSNGMPLTGNPKDDGFPWQRINEPLLSPPNPEAFETPAGYPYTVMEQQAASLQIGPVLVEAIFTIVHHLEVEPNICKKPLHHKIAWKAAWRATKAGTQYFYTHSGNVVYKYHCDAGIPKVMLVSRLNDNPLPHGFRTPAGVPLKTDVNDPDNPDDFWAPAALMSGLMDGNDDALENNRAKPLLYTSVWPKPSSGDPEIEDIFTPFFNAGNFQFQISCCEVHICFGVK